MLKIDTIGQASPLLWGKIIRETDKFGGMCLIIGRKFVGETRVWCDAEDCSWGCELVLIGS